MTISYTRTFSHTDWVDNVDRVQAGGDSGFNGRFHSLEAEFDTISGVVSQVNDQLTTQSGEITVLQQEISALSVTVAASVTVGLPPLMRPATPSDIGVDAWSVVWGDASNGTYATIDSGLQNANGILPLSLPEGVKLLSLTVLGDAPNPGSMTTSLIQEMRASPFTRTHLADVTGFASTLITNSPVFNSQQYLFYLTASIPQDKSMQDPHLHGFTITYQPSI
jgi:hypothetical protein